MPKVDKIIQSFNGGELSPLMDSRIDQQKYLAGCRTLENFIPLIYGGAERRPGLKYIASQKASGSKGRVVGFEHSVSDTYMLLFEDLVIRFFKDGAQVLGGEGTEDLSGQSTGLIAHWKLNETTGTAVDDAVASIPHDGVASGNITTITDVGKVGTGCFDLDGVHRVIITNDHAELSFIGGGVDAAANRLLLSVPR